MELEKPTYRIMDLAESERPRERLALLRRLPFLAENLKMRVRRRIR